MRPSIVLIGVIVLLTSRISAAQAVDYKAMEKLWVLPSPTPAKDAKGRDLIRVRIYPHDFSDASKRAAEPLERVTLNGVCQAFVAHDSKVESSGKRVGNFKPGTTLKIEVGIEKLKKPLWLECSGPLTIQRKAPLTSHSYEGNFYINAASSPTFPGGPHVQIINVLPLESYLRGVVPTEMIPSWPKESLKAQAVAARSYAYFNMAHNQYFPKPRIYDVDDSNHYQAYSGLTNIHANTDEAITATGGYILTYQGKYFPTFFDTDAGGHTESAKEVFGLEAPYVAAKAEPVEVVQALKPWSVTVKLAELVKGLGSIAPPGRALENLLVDPADRTLGKRVRFVQAKFEGGKQLAIPIADFRRAAGQLQSSLFTLSVAEDSVKIDGKGKGHGVGLSQMGAKHLAKAGWNYRKILDFYFKDVTLCSRLGVAEGVPACH